jgi:signal peptidase I
MADEPHRPPPHITPPPPLAPLGDLVAPPKAFFDAMPAIPRPPTLAPTPEAPPEEQREPTPPPPAAPKDAVRDIVETVVFVVVLVLLLKTFIAEAFVIPTGSMATTLWGYQKVVTCPQCAEVFPVNCSSEVDPQHGDPSLVTGCICPNCRVPIQWEVETNDQGRIVKVQGPSWNSGDRVLVSKFLYDSGLRKPERQDVVVFKYPEGPQKNHVAMNYIKRLVGKPGETIGIYYGDLYVAEGMHTPADNPEDQYKIRKLDYTHRDEDAKTLQADALKPIKPEGKGRPPTESRQFHIIRKAPDKVLALSRLVYDNDHQAEDLREKGKLYQRWVSAGDGDAGAWKPVDPQRPVAFQHAARKGGDLAWLRYRHVLRDAPLDEKTGKPKPTLITDFMGYNTANRKMQHLNWVGDLILECEVQLEKAPVDQDVLELELSRGPDRFTAQFQLAAGRCVLTRAIKNPEGGFRVVQLTDGVVGRLRLPGTYRLRFANVDQCLTLWIDEEVFFLEPGKNHGLAYNPPRYFGPDQDPNPETNNDLNPASIGVRGAAITVSHLRLLRDSYYTTGGPAPDANLADDAWGTPEKWEPLREITPRTLYVQPGHYLCLGDNSSESSDGREWGLVPERLLLGRALVVYYPFKPLGQVNRAGPIR